MEIKINKSICGNCGYEWYPRKIGGVPKQCPSCKVNKYNMERRKRREELKKLEEKQEVKQNTKIKIKKSLFG